MAKQVKPAWPPSNRPARARPARFGRRSLPDYPERALQSAWTTIQGSKVHSRIGIDPEAPNRPSVVLVHGFVVSSLYLEPVGRILATDMDVYTPDQPGFGRSESVDGCDTIEGMAEWLVRYIDELGLHQPAFLANSMGCQIVVEAAIRHPEKMGNLVLAGPVVDPRLRSVPRLIWHSLQLYPKERPPLIKIHAIDYLRAGPRLLLRTLRSMMEYPIEHKLPLIPDPVLVVRGQYDKVVPLQWAEECARLLPKGRLVNLPGAAHTTNYSNPLELARVSRPFLVPGNGPATVRSLKECALSQPALQYDQHQGTCRTK